MILKKFEYAILMMGLFCLFLLEPSQGYSQVYLDSTASVEERVEDLLSQMTRDEKIGQVMQVDYSVLDSLADFQHYFLGSLLSGANGGPGNKTAEEWADFYDEVQSYGLGTRLGIPILFGVDAVHGIGNVYGSTIFPHNIGLGCTRNAELVKQAARITAKETAATGIDWTFGPTVAVARNIRWGRTYESFGEDPTLVKEMSAAAVLGFQGDSLSDPTSIIGCAKHYLGDGGTTNGVNNGNTDMDEQTLRDIHLPGYISALEENVGSVMVSHGKWNGQQRN